MGSKLILGDWTRCAEIATPIRFKVFVDEQRVPAAEELDEFDAVSLHAVVTLDGEPIATGRLCPDGRIGRMAVLNEFRGQGFGGLLLSALIEAARDQGHQEVFLHAQCQALGFYESLGFVAEGPVFSEAGIDHRLMRQSLDDRAGGTSS
jgi:predicted GNAT family N-acyltransferase